MKTRLDVITRALRRIGVAAVDEDPTADQIQSVGSVYDALLEEISSVFGKSIPADSVPPEAFIPLANLLAVEVAHDTGASPHQSRGTALIRLLAVLRPDDRTEVPEAEYF
jgi:hypothetical protein